MAQGSEVQAVSMARIARECGVAASTVSRAMRGDPRIGGETRARVAAAVERLGYRPHPLVAALMAQVRNRRPPSVKWNLAWLDLDADSTFWRRDPVCRAFVRGASERAATAGYALERVWGRALRVRERLTDVLLSRGIRGVMLQGFAEAADGRAGSIPIDLDRFAVVSVGTSFRDPALHFASNDQHHSTQTAVRELWRLGYRRIGYVGRPLIESVVNHRFYAGYVSTLEQEFGADAPPPLLEPGEAALAAWVRRHRPEAIISTEGHIPAALAGYGWSVPRDIGFAHLHVANDDEITSGICQQSEAVAAAATDLLVGALANNELGVPAHPRGVLIPGRWRAGRTVRAAG